MEPLGIGRLVRNREVNAVLSWALVVLLAALTVEEVLTDDPLWAVFSLGVVVVAVLPASKFRSPAVMPHWEVLTLAALPVFGRAFATWELTTDLTMYLSVAALALLVAVELHVFTPVKMSVGFAVVFVVVTTMAASGVWAVVRWLLDIQFGTGFIASERALMVEFVSSTAAGIGGGFLFEFYFRRIERVERLPDSVADELTDELQELEQNVEDVV